MFEDMAVKMAKIMTEYSVPVNKGDVTFIMAGADTEPLERALYEAVLRRGGHPTIIRPGPAGLGELYFELADEDQLNYIDPIWETVSQKANILFNIWSRSNTKSMAKTDPQKMMVHQRANGSVPKIMDEREKAGEFRWCIMPWPSQGDAQEAEMGLLAHTRFIYEACGFHLDDPIAHWQGVQARQEKLVNFLSDKSRAVVKGPGIDLSLEFKDRVWISAHGVRNFPDGEIFTGPVEDSVNGTVEFNMRTVYGGREVSGVRFEYKDGKIVDASAEKGEEFLLSTLDTDEGARRMGEFAIGTNWGIQDVTGSTLFDEKIGGTIHMAIGRSIQSTLGVNESVVHWDMVHDMKEGGEITIDGQPFYKNGKFEIDLA